MAGYDEVLVRSSVVSKAAKAIMENLRDRSLLDGVCDYETIEEIQSEIEAEVSKAIMEAEDIAERENVQDAGGVGAEFK